MLEAELDEDLGYEKSSALGNNSGNSRNGYGKKTVIANFFEDRIQEEMASYEKSDGFDPNPPQH